MFEVNVGKKEVPWSQRKSKFVHIQRGQLGFNQIDYRCVCNVHAICNALEYSGWSLPIDNVYKRAPDSLANFIITECLKENNWFKTKMPVYWNKWYEGQKDAITPLELHDVLAHYVNEWLGCTKADVFHTDLTIRDILKQLYEKNIAIPISIAWGGLQGHVITLVGFEATSEKELNDYLNGYDNNKKASDVITNIIWDDPWGYFDYKTNKYDGTKSGNDNKAPIDFFWNHMKALENKNRKFGHIIAKPAALV